MGKKIFDQYSLLHFASGVIAYHWNISLKNFIVMHFLFELLENTTYGIFIINKYFKNIWPGGKDEKDAFMNSFIGDNFFGITGWIIAKKLDDYYKN